MRLTRLTFVASLALHAVFAAGAGAQSAPARDSIRDDARFSFYARGPYRPNVPRPESILGYDVGAMSTQFAMQEKTLLAIADAAKDRVRVEEIGATNERRTMRIYIISSPENIQRLDAIRADLDRIADPRGATAADLQAVVARTPAVVWINESVHGNESPGFETAMQTLYHFAASDEPATVAALRNTLVILNPSTNPDGHERFTVWYNSIGVNSPEPASLEKDEPWSIQGRFNHYRFDMNRDVMTSTQREVQALVRAQVKWHPMVAIDQHGQVSTYFFPTAPALNPNLGADFVRWMEIYGKANAAAFDRFGWMYYSRDVFDFYGPFYWDSWPSLSGAIGMTYETDGGGWKGHVWRREDGTLVTLRDGVAKHFTTALATVFATAERHTERVRDYLAFRQRAIADGRTDRMKRVVLLPGADPARAGELVTALLRSGIEVRRTTAAFSSTRAHAYADDVAGTRRFDAGAYVIDMSQPQGKMAKAFLDPSPPLDTVFARAQVEKYRRNVRRGTNEGREGYEFYDVTTWSLPVTFGVDAFWTEDAPAITGDLLVAPAEAATTQGAAPAKRIGGELLAVNVSGGIVSGRPAQSAYLFSGERNGASRLAFHLLHENYRVAVTTTHIEAGGRNWPRGTYVVRVARNDSTIHGRLDALARESGVEAVGVNSASTESQQYGIGSENVVALVTPKVALVGDEGISQTAYGAIWWTLERRYGIPFTPISLGVLSGGDLSPYNVIIIPDASGGALNGRLGKAGADRLREWARAGGTLVTMDGATGWAARDDVNLTSARPVAAPRDTSAKPAAAAPTTDSVTAATRAREKAPDRTQSDLLAVTSPTATADDPAGLPGSHFDVVLDRTHWLTSGYERPRLTVMLDGSRFLKLSKEGTNVAVFPSTGTLHRSGFVFPENTERLLRGTALLIDEPTGGGHVVLFNNEPMFRAWWRSLDRLVLNAIILGPAF